MGAEKKLAVLQFCKCESLKDDIVLASLEIDLTEHLSDEWVEHSVKLTTMSEWEDKFSEAELTYRVKSSLLKDKHKAVYADLQITNQLEAEKRKAENKQEEKGELKRSSKKIKKDEEQKQGKEGEEDKSS